MLGLWLSLCSLWASTWPLYQPDLQKWWFMAPKKLPGLLSLRPRTGTTSLLPHPLLKRSQRRPRCIVGGHECREVGAHWGIFGDYIGVPIRGDQKLCLSFSSCSTPPPGPPSPTDARGKENRPGTTGDREGLCGTPPSARPGQWPEYHLILP